MGEPTKATWATRQEEKQTLSNCVGARRSETEDGSGRQTTHKVQPRECRVSGQNEFERSEKEKLGVRERNQHD